MEYKKTEPKIHNIKKTFKKHGSKFGRLRFGKHCSKEKKGHETRDGWRCADSCYHEDPKHAWKKKKKTSNEQKSNAIHFGGKSKANNN